MLTADDGRSDGKFISYLDNPSEWRRYDPELFDYLRNTVKEKNIRNVSAMEDSSILPAASYHADILTDDALWRSSYFRNLYNTCQQKDMIFFDPDNGTEVKSVSCGKKTSSKYLYWHELEESYSKGYSVLLYQHFRRVKRDIFIDSLVSEIRSRCGAPEAFSFSTSNVVFFLVPQEKHMDSFQNGVQLLKMTWHDQIGVVHHKGDFCI